MVVMIEDLIMDRIKRISIEASEVAGQKMKLLDRLAVDCIRAYQEAEYTYLGIGVVAIS